MSHHPNRPLQPRPAWHLNGVPPVQHPVLWMVSTPLPTLQRLLLLTIGTAAIAKRPFCASQESLGGMMGRSRETVNRALRQLALQRLIWVKRRGRRLTNVYLLARRVWAAITGKQPPYPRDRQLHLRYHEGVWSGLSPVRAAMGALGYSRSPGSNTGIPMQLHPAGGV